MELNLNPNFVYLRSIYDIDPSDNNDFLPLWLHPVPSLTHEVHLTQVGNEGDNNTLYAEYRPFRQEDRPLDLRRRLPTRRTGNDYRLSADPTKTVCASFHQNSMDMGLEFRGHQSTSMALTAILTNSTLPLHMWNFQDLDRILPNGDVLHGEITKSAFVEFVPRDLKSGNQHYYILPRPGDDVDWAMGQCSNFAHNIFKSVRYFGKVRKLNQRNQFGISMETAILEILKHGYQNIMVSIDGRTGALIKDEDGHFRYFDPRCYNKIGRRSQVGTAVLLIFETIKDFIKHIHKRQSRSDSQFEVYGINVKKCGHVGRRRRRDN